MTDFKIVPAGKEFVRPGGRDGDWWPDPQDDDSVVSPFEFVEVAGGDATDLLRTLQRQVAGRKTPILFGSPHNYGLTIERMIDAEIDAAEVLSGLARFDLEAWFADRVGEAQVWQDDLGKIVPPRGSWPRSAPNITTLASINEDIFGGVHEVAMIGLVPTSEAFEVPALIGFGDFDDSPEPIVHVALAREWQARYGATIAAITLDTIEFTVAHPPKTRDDAERLALEHFHYCRATITGTLQEAAASLIGSTVWRFTWD